MVFRDGGETVPASAGDYCLEEARLE